MINISWYFSIHTKENWYRGNIKKINKEINPIKKFLFFKSKNIKKIYITKFLFYHYHIFESKKLKIIGKLHSDGTPRFDPLNLLN